MPVLVIPCSKQKADVKSAPAHVMYGASAFNRGLQAYALKFYKPKDIYFLSARYGLVRWDEPIAVYEEKLGAITQAKKELLVKKKRDLKCFIRRFVF